MVSRAEILDRAQRVLDEADRRKREGVYPCEECKFRRKRLLGNYCVHPIVQVAQMNCTDESEREYLASCSDQRSVKSVWGPSVCGPDGELFEPREPTLWEKILG